MNRKKIICAFLAVIASAVLTNSVMDRIEVRAEARLEEAQAHLSKEVFRFHVLANSDSETDQALKLEVRDEILAYMNETMPQKNISATRTHQWVTEHLEELKSVAKSVIFKAGYTYDVEAEVCKTYFPDRRYGEILFPKGYYDALRIKIGEAKGHNWWCVLYPNLCFTDAVCAKIDDKGEQELQNILTEDEYEMVTVNSHFKIKSFFLERLWGENER